MRRYRIKQFQAVKGRYCATIRLHGCATSLQIFDHSDVVAEVRNDHTEAQEALSPRREFSRLLVGC